MQYLSIRYTERLAEAGMESSVGSVGESYDNVLAESVIGLFKTELITSCQPQLTEGLTKAGVRVCRIKGRAEAFCAAAVQIQPTQVAADPLVADT